MGPDEWRTPRGEKGCLAEPVNQAADLWTKCTGSLREQVSDSTWQLWLSGIKPVEYADGVFVLEVPNGLIRERVESRYLPMIEDTLANEVGAPVRGHLQVHERAPADAGGRAVVAPVAELDEVFGLPADPLPASFGTGAGAGALPPTGGDKPGRESPAVQ